MTTTWPKAVYTAAQTRAIDAAIIAQGVPGPQLMQRAADAVWAEIHRRWPQVGRLTVVCGKGNNGGDGYLVARLAWLAGWQVRVLSVAGPAELGGDALLAQRSAVAAGVAISAWEPDSELEGVVLDALLGSGLQGQVREPFRAVISALNASGLPVVSVDIPSGLDADSGCILGLAVKARLTVTFITLKPGLLTAAGPDQTGELVFAGLATAPAGMPRPALERLLPADWADVLPRRPRAAHKGLFGHVVLLGGDHGMGGAIMLAAEAALRSGAGRVSVLTRPEHVAALLGRCPEVMALGVTDAGEAQALLERADTLVIGPGLGRSGWSHRLYELGMAMAVPKVLDADALNILADAGGIPASLCERDIITPHPAEAARLLGCDTAQVQDDRIRALSSLVERFGCAVVLKGVGSLIAAAGDAGLPPGICTFGNPAMATAGMGDVLSGVAGALLAQALPAGQAARYAVLVHALAGDTAAQGDHRGLLAGDLMLPLRYWLNARETT